MSQDRQTAVTLTNATGVVRSIEPPSDPVTPRPDDDAQRPAAPRPFSDPALVLALTFTANGLAG